MSDTAQMADVPVALADEVGHERISAIRTERWSVSYVSPDALDRVFDQVAPMIESALEHGQGDCTNLAAICAGINRGELQLWAVHSGPEITGIVVFELIQHPCKRSVFVTLVAGSGFDEAVGVVERLLRDYAEICGADTIEASVRDGLARKLTARNWRRKATIMELSQ